MDREALLEVENAVLRAISKYDSVLRVEALDAMLAALGRYVSFAHGGITTSDGPGAFRALAVTQAVADAVVPTRMRVPSSPIIWETVYEKGLPLHRRRLSSDDPVDRVAQAGRLGSYSLYPIRDESGRVFAALYLAFVEPDANDSIPPDLARRVTDAIAPSVERGLVATRERRALRILDASGDAMLAWDKDGRITDLNIAAETMTGASREQLLGSTIGEILGTTPEAPAHGLRFSLRAKSGRVIPVAATVSAVQGDPLVTAHALLRDLSDVVAAEEQAAAHLADLRRLSEQHTVLLDNAPMLIFRLDPVTEELLYLNRHAERLFGVSAGDALACPGWLRDLHVDPEGRDAFAAAVATAKRGETSQPYEARLGRSAAEAITARGNIYPILAGKDGETPTLVGIEGVLLDVTGERAARTRLVQADRLATVGMLAAGVVHEINNPAAFMLLGLDALARQLSGPNVVLSPPAAENVKQLVDDLRETGKRIVDIARDMRFFASPPGADTGRRVAVDVARTIESALTITRAQIVERADIEVDLEDDLPPVLMEEGRLGQVLVNLLVNAAQSFARSPLPPLSNAFTRPREVVRVTAHSTDANVVVIVEDTGEGMDPGVLSRLFTPFFTTKGADSGTGLGLAISKAIVEGAGGTISATSPGTLGEPPRGARFEVVLPAYGEEVLRAARAQAEERSAAASAEKERREDLS